MHTNPLIHEKSPYLLQHAHNPVDWQPWGEAAFERARAEDKPVFLSIGYSTCHWCHVMERESFESEAVAELLNRHFISIKVDREERPDIDKVYMTFVQATTGSGGWPMSVWMTPDAKPFFGGTYFPPDNRYGRPGFSTLLEYIANAWLSRRDEILGSVDQILGELAKHTQIDTSTGTWLDDSVLDSCFAVFRRSYDSRLGGFGGAPKFPRPVTNNFLLRYAREHAPADTARHEAAEMVLFTLREMAKGGMYDHIGGGFHRYSVDERWFVSHFEKMLYDQAQLAISYLEAFQLTGDTGFSAVARDIFDYVRRDMTDSGGGFYSAEDADSAADASKPNEKGEGAFYIWAASELEEALGAGRAALFQERFGVEAGGNVTADPHGEFTGRNILFQARTAEQVAARAGRPVEEVEGELAAARAILLDRRAQRPRPHLDDKILTCWNGMMISAFARGGSILGDDSLTGAASAAARFVLENLWKDGVLLRRYRDGEAAIPGFLEDYAFFAQALRDLYEVTFDGEWLDHAVEIAAAMVARFEDAAAGGFFSSADPGGLILRMKDDYDGAEPSGNSAAIEVLSRLSAMTGREDFRKSAERALEAFSPKLRPAPHALPQMLVGYLLSRRPAGQVVLAGDPASAGFAALAREVRKRFLPEYVLMRADPERFPATAAMVTGERGAKAYVCRNFTCELPVASVEQLGELLQ
ncbi:MAG: thioredoxin domain-containing protein [Bryobacteraceae bacterium]